MATRKGGSETWPEEDVKVLVRLVKWGWTNSQIGKALGVSRCAVGAKMARLKLKREVAAGLRKIGV